MDRTAQSRQGVPVRLPDERWAHIVEEHSELAGMREDVLHVIADAERVLEGSHGEKLAVGSVEPGKV